MKTLSIVICAGLFFVACVGSASGRGTDELLVRVRLTTGERSKDSGSLTTTITVERDAIELVGTYGGSSRRRPNPPRKVYKLSPAEKRNLVELIKSNHLLTTDSIELPRPSSNYQYFEVSLDLTLGGKKGAVNISGPRNAAGVKDKSLYQSTRLLIAELYRIMNGHDKSVHFEELILDRTGR
ncbi:MAG TPA: hypothetical protein VF611_18675 [Pyrinomonadaceae bacterium]|jgi:hypothetical protein